MKTDEFELKIREDRIVISGFPIFIDWDRNKAQLMFDKDTAKILAEEILKLK